MGVRDMRTLGSQVKQTVTAHTVTDEIHTWGGKIRPTNGGAVWGPRLRICRTLEKTCRKAFVNLQVTQDNTVDREWSPLCSCVLVRVPQATVRLQVNRECRQGALLPSPVPKGVTKGRVPRMLHILDAFPENHLTGVTGNRS